MADATLHWLTGEGSVELTIRRSRFLGHALPCPNEQAAAERLGRLRAAHPKATHHVHAWRLRSAETGLVRHHFDDDGEPGGTAGRPVLGALEARGIVDALVVVVRYFGGIKLGAGGLVRAYGEAAGKALAAADVRPLVPVRLVVVTVPFAQVSVLERIAAHEQLAVQSRDYGVDATLVLEVPEGRIESLVRELADLTSGAVRIDLQGAPGDPQAGD